MNKWQLRERQAEMLARSKRVCAARQFELVKQPPGDSDAKKKRYPQQSPRQAARFLQWAKMVSHDPNEYSTIVQRVAAAELHRVGLVHDRSECPECEREHQTEAGTYPATTGSSNEW